MTTRRGRGRTRGGGGAALGPRVQRHAMNLRALHKYILELEGSLIRGSREQEEAAPFFFPPRFSLARRRWVSRPDSFLIALLLWKGFSRKVSGNSARNQPTSDKRVLRCLDECAPGSSGATDARRRLFWNLCSCKDEVLSHEALQPTIEMSSSSDSASWRHDPTLELK